MSVELFLGGLLERHVAVIGAGVVDQKVETLGAELGERAFHAIDEGVERSDRASVQLQCDRIRSACFLRRRRFPRRRHGCDR